MVGFLLEAEDVLFGVGVGFQGFVPIEVVGCEVGDDGDVWATLDLFEVVELEATEFEDDEVLGLYLLDELEEVFFTDVSAQPDVVFGGEGACVWCGWLGDPRDESRG